MNVNSMLGDVRNRLKIQSENHVDELVRIRDIQFHSIEEIQIGSSSYRMRPAAQQGMAYRMGGIPLSYLRKCPPDLAARNLNHWLTEESNDELFFRFDGDAVRAVMTPRYIPINHLDVVNHLIDKMEFKENTEVQVDMDSNFLSLSIPDHQNGFSVRGDDHLPGISISNSEVGISALHVSAMIIRLICSNGLITSACKGKKSFRHVSNGILDDLPRHVSEIVNDSHLQTERLAISMDSKVDDPDATLKEFFKKFQVSKKEKEAVAWGYEQEPVGEDTMFSIIQSFTRGAQYRDLSAESANKLQVVGGKILSLVNH